MIKAEVVFNGGQMLINDYTICNEYGLIIIYLNNEKIDRDDWCDERGCGSLEQAIAYCLEQGHG